MAAHIAMEQEHLERSGLPTVEARRQAMVAFGGIERHKEAVRDERGTRLLGDLSMDFRYARRRIRNHPGFATAVVGVLALGIGATTAMFSAVDAAMLRPLPFLRPQELVAVRDIHFPYDLRFALGGAPSASTAPRPHDPRFVEVAGMHEIFSHVAGYAAGAMNIGDPSRPLRARVGVVTSDFFATVGVVPVRGRAFVPAEGLPNGPKSAVISYGLWQSQFGGSDVVGKPIVLGEHSFVIVGIAPRGFTFPQRSDLWIPLVVPLDPNASDALGRATPSDVVARLAPGVTVASAARRLQLRWEQDAREGNPPSRQKANNTLVDVRTHGAMMPLRQSLLGDHGHALVLLLGATGMLLLIACANVSHLLLSQVATRRREVAVREVLGASRGRVIRQFLVECSLLSLGGAFLGMGLAWTLAGLLARLLPMEEAGIAPVHVDLRVMAFAVALALVSGIVLGLWPALGVTRAAPVEAIKGGGARGMTAVSRRLRGALVATELALTVALLISGALLLRSFRDVITTDIGMRTSHVATLSMAFPLATVKPLDPTITNTDQLHDIWGLERQRLRVAAMIDQLSHVPGISAAAAVNNLPLDGETGLGLEQWLYGAGAPRLPDDGGRVARTADITDEYFRVMGIPLLRGRTFVPGDDSVAPPVAVISHTLAEQFWPGRDPIGQRFGFMARDSDAITVVGVVGDVHDQSLDQAPMSQAYFPMRQSSAPPFVALVVRGTLGSGALLAALRQSVHAVNPVQAVYNVRTMNDVIDSSVAPRRTTTTLLMLFASLALVLAVLGVYSVVAYGIAQRARELGIRAALGATGGNLLALVVREAAGSACVGVLVGVAVAWALSRLLAGFLYGVSAHDPVTFVVAPLALLATTVAATLIPAFGVLRVNPADVMRTD